MKILVASNNRKKLDELRRILAARPSLALEVVSPRDAGLDIDPVEDGDTFAANALKKARAFAPHFDGLVLADDSGLCVDALGGAPGVHSARFAGRHGDDAANRALLLDRLDGLPEAERGAYFACTIAIVRGDDVLLETSGTCRGRILDRERGDGGFGYDPLFLHVESGQTFAEIPADEKDQLSHRGAALREVSRFLAKNVQELPEG